MDSSVTLILTIASILVFTPYIANFLKLPATPIEIILGSLSVPLGIISEGGGEAKIYFDLMAKVGFLYLMFLAGLEVNLKEILKTPSQHFVAAILFILIMAFLAVLIGYFIFGFNVIVVSALPLISIGILATLSKEYGKNEGWIKTAFYVGAIAEVVSITAITVLEVWVEVGFGEELYTRMFYLFFYLGGVVGVYYFLHQLFWWYPEFKNTLMPYSDSKDQDFRLAIGIFFAMIVLMKLIHLELAFGAFIAGLFISTFFHHRRELEHKISSFGFGFLVPIFFIHVGASFNYGYLAKALEMAVQIFVVMTLIRLLSAFVFIRFIGIRQAALVAFSLSMPLTLLVAAATLGFHKGILGEVPYYAIIFASLVEVIVGMVIIKLIAKR